MKDSGWWATPMLFERKTRAAYVAEWYGKKTTREIAEEIGTTRNAVIGKARRLGLSKPKLSPFGYTGGRTED